jgi:hypothetical protein
LPKTPARREIKKPAKRRVVDVNNGTAFSSQNAATLRTAAKRAVTTAQATVNATESRRKADAARMEGRSGPDPLSSPQSG